MSTTDPTWTPYPCACGHYWADHRNALGRQHPLPCTVTGCTCGHYAPMVSSPVPPDAPAAGPQPQRR